MNADVVLSFKVSMLSNNRTFHSFGLIVILTTSSSVQMISDNVKFLLRVTKLTIDKVDTKGPKVNLAEAQTFADAIFMGVNGKMNQLIYPRKNQTIFDIESLRVSLTSVKHEKQAIVFNAHAEDLEL
eukprot:TRINITY_DN3272_c0_g2_i1.p1 TRINITY_DN3272_c0_g2~~TRINITY_DN3272_c0_g2_i1.p1  ORF type:complete len:127 (+),score=18.52 TRINITY_DN3272_c0_g2_i1:1062-1442(+)